jgi:hypothetical protein
MSVNPEPHSFEGRMNERLEAAIRVDETTRRPRDESEAFSVATSSLGMRGVGWVVSHSHWPR